MNGNDDIEKKDSDEVASKPVPTRTDLAKELEINEGSLMPDGLPVSIE